MAAKIWTREEIATLLENNDRAVERAITVLYACQTEDERASHMTRHRNGRGFNALHASFGCSLGRWLERGRNFSPAQLNAARKMLRRYVGQLTAIANEKAIAKAGNEPIIDIPSSDIN